MIIEDPDAFRNWLTAKLGPLCDADPQALAKYVYALVKKDKPIEELRNTMLDQLEVFLERDTREFVEDLFRTLETQAFELKPDAPSAVAPTQEPKTVAPHEPSFGEVKKDVFLQQPPLVVDDSDVRSTKDSNPAFVAGAQNINNISTVLLPSASSRKESERHIRKADSDKEDKSSRRGRRRESSTSPERRRSRSRSLDRRRSRSRERDRGRAWRNKSPPLRRYDRRRTYSKSPPRRYSKSRSPQAKRTRYRNRSPPRSRSRSPLGSRERKDASTGLSPKEVANHGDTDMRNLQSVVNVPPDVQFPRRCRDFDEQGYCMRGDLCPFDHGADPVILEDLPVPPVFNGGPQQAPPPLVPQVPPPSLIRHPVHPPIRPPPPINLAEYNPDAPSMEPRMWGRPPRFRGGPVMRGVMRGMGRGGFPPHQRELINVVGGVLHFRHPRPMNPNEFNGRVPGNEGPPPGFDYGRLGNPRAPPFHPKNGNTSLQLKRIPPGANNITHLNEHFSRFGKIVNIQVCFEGDPESALVTFSNHTEANIAIKSTEAVMNNRFIRVFWYNQNNNNNNNMNNSNANNENKQENTPPATRSSVLERLGAHPSKVLNNIQPSAVQPEEKVTAVNNNLSKTLYIPSAKKDAAVLNAQAQKSQNNEELKKKLEEVTLAKKKQQDAIKAGFKLNADLRKRKTELLEKQINQQKLLIQRMEDPASSAQQKSALMDTIKTLQDSIEQIRKDLKSSVKPILSGRVTKQSAVAEQRAFLVSSRDEAKRQLLDAELDLMKKTHEGKNTEELIKRVADLKSTIFKLEASCNRSASRGRGGGATRLSRGRGRGSKFVSKNISYDHNVVDHRPTKVLISGYEQDDKDGLIQHFEKFGKIVNYESDDATPSLVVNYSSRKEAELAINTGKNFEDRVLSVTWATPNMNIRSGVITKPETSSRSVSIVEDEEVEEEAMEDMEDDYEYVALLSPTSSNPIEDTEEEEDRSWRR